ncbi:MAG: class I SAM-dependent methyltransferase [Planctomycetes bacterium]|nr:class I SAM-dependent methyltransferase [Planctomycetota bacterium]
MENDKKTADAFADSWNNLPSGSIYTREQFTDWLAPLEEADVKDKTVLELGCGNASLMVHMAKWEPARLAGCDLGDSVITAEKNMSGLDFKNWEIIKADLVSYRGPGYDLVYCIGVLHHLKDPFQGFTAVLENTKPGGRFHCWVYAEEGNWVIINIVDRIRKVASKLPWWLTKYFIATPLVFPYYVYAKILNAFKGIKSLKYLPLYEYSLWISQRNFVFFRHVAFDQLGTPQTAYLSRQVIEDWLKRKQAEIDPDSLYIIFRNGNSWKFGGKKI